MVSSKISGIPYRLVFGEGALIDVARWGLDGDDMRARGERRDIKGVVRPVDLRGHLNRVGHWRGNLHVIVTDYPVAVNDNVLGLNIIVIIGQWHVKIQWLSFTIMFWTFLFQNDLPCISMRNKTHQ